MDKGTRLNGLTERIIGSAINVHRELGPVLLKSVYEACLFHDLIQSNLKVEKQGSYPNVGGYHNM